MRSLSSLLSIPNLKMRLIHPIDELWDRRLGVRTFGFHPSDKPHDDPEWGSFFVPLGWRDIFTVFDAVELKPDDIVTDLGCGTGRAVFAAAYRGAKRAVGVEYVPWLADVAKQNKQRGRLADKDIVIIEGDAREVSLADTTVLYMFHALGTAVLQGVLDKAKRDRDAAGSGPLRICYVNPVHGDVLDRADWLRPVKEADVKGFRCTVRIWESL